METDKPQIPTARISSEIPTSSQQVRTLTNIRKKYAMSSDDSESDSGKSPKRSKLS